MMRQQKKAIVRLILTVFLVMVLCYGPDLFSQEMKPDTIGIEKTEFEPGEDIRIDYRCSEDNLPYLWIGIFKADLDDQMMKGAGLSIKILGELNSSVLLNAPKTPGNYQVRLFSMQSGNVSLHHRLNFEVKEKGDRNILPGSNQESLTSMEKQTLPAGSKPMVGKVIEKEHFLTIEEFKISGGYWFTTSVMVELSRQALSNRKTSYRFVPKGFAFSESGISPILTVFKKGGKTFETVRDNISERLFIPDGNSIFTEGINRTLDNMSKNAEIKAGEWTESVHVISEKYTGIPDFKIPVAFKSKPANKDKSLIIISFESKSFTFRIKDNMSVSQKFKGFAIMVADKKHTYCSAFKYEGEVACQGKRNETFIGQQICFMRNPKNGSALLKKSSVNNLEELFSEFPIRNVSPGTFNQEKIPPPKWLGKIFGMSRLLQTNASVIAEHRTNLLPILGAIAFTHVMDNVYTIGHNMGNLLFEVFHGQTKNLDTVGILDHLTKTDASPLSKFYEGGARKVFNIGSKIGLVDPANIESYSKISGQIVKLTGDSLSPISNFAKVLKSSSVFKEILKGIEIIDKSMFFKGVYDLGMDIGEEIFKITHPFQPSNKILGAGKGPGTGTPASGAKEPEVDKGKGISPGTPANGNKEPKDDDLGTPANGTAEDKKKEKKPEVVAEVNNDSSPSIKCPKREYKTLYVFGFKRYQEDDMFAQIKALSDQGWKIAHIIWPPSILFVKEDQNSKPYEVEMLGSDDATEIEKINSLASQNWEVVDSLGIVLFLKSKDNISYKYHYYDSQNKYPDFLPGGNNIAIFNSFGKEGKELICFNGVWALFRHVENNNTTYEYMSYRIKDEESLRKLQELYAEGWQYCGRPFAWMWQGKPADGERDTPLILKKSSNQEKKVELTYVISSYENANILSDSSEKIQQYYLKLINKANELGDKGWMFEALIYANEKTFGKNKVILLFHRSGGLEATAAPTLGGWTPPVDHAEITVEYWENLTTAQQKYLHYHRNKYQEDAGIPLKKSELVDGEWECGDEEALAHNVGEDVSGNIDCRGVGSREGQQAIFDSNGDLVTTPENMGTYDFVPPPILKSVIDSTKESFGSIIESIKKSIGSDKEGIRGLIESTKKNFVNIESAKERIREIIDSTKKSFERNRSIKESIKERFAIIEIVHEMIKKSIKSTDTKGMNEIINKSIKEIIKENIESAESIKEIIIDNDFKGHFITDVNPWLRWGNSKNDTTTCLKRKEALCSSLLGKLGFWLYGEECKKE